MHYTHSADTENSTSVCSCVLSRSLAHSLLVCHCDYTRVHTFKCILHCDVLFFFHFLSVVCFCCFVFLVLGVRFGRMSPYLWCITTLIKQLFSPQLLRSSILQRLQYIEAPHAELHFHCMLHVSRQRIIAMKNVHNLLCWMPTGNMLTTARGLFESAYL